LNRSHTEQISVFFQTFFQHTEISDTTLNFLSVNTRWYFNLPHKKIPRGILIFFNLPQKKNTMWYLDKSFHPKIPRGILKQYNYKKIPRGIWIKVSIQKYHVVFIQTIHTTKLINTQENYLLIFYFFLYTLLFFLELFFLYVDLDFLLLKKTLLICLNAKMM
jgi:hypothetical protein